MLQAQTELQGQVVTRKNKHHKNLEELKKEMSPELIKHLIATATERQEGLVVSVESKHLHRRASKITFKDTKPSHVIMLDDGRIGFCIEKQSYMGDPVASTSFLRWLGQANQKAIKEEDYGQPTCEFRRTY